MVTHRCDACGLEFEATMDSCPRCGEPPGDGNTASTAKIVGIEERFTSRLRAVVPDGSDVAYKTAEALALGYAVLVTVSLVLRSLPLFAVGVLLMFASLFAMYLDLLNLETRLYNVRPILWIVGALLMYFLVVPLYLYQRPRTVG